MFMRLVDLLHDAELDISLPEIGAPRPTTIITGEKIPARKIEPQSAPMHEPVVLP